MATAPRSTILYSEGQKITGLRGSSSFMKDFACFRAGIASFEKDPKAVNSVKSVAKNIGGLDTVATWIILRSLFLNLNKQLLTVEIFPPQHKIFSVRMCTEIKFEVRCCAMKSRATRRSCALNKALIRSRKDRSFGTLNTISNCVLCVLFFYSSPFKNTNTREPLNYFFFKSLNWIKGISTNTNSSANLDKNNVFVVKIARSIRRAR